MWYQMHTVASAVVNVVLVHKCGIRLMNVVDICGIRFIYVVSGAYVSCCVNVVHLYGKCGTST